jgi:hypothetical protein
MGNYFNTLSLREQLLQLGQAEFLDGSEFSDGVEAPIFDKPDFFRCNELN